MKLYITLLILLVALCLVAVVSMLTPEGDGARGVDHPVYSSMMHGGSGVERHANILWLNWAFGTLSLLVFATLIAIGVRKGRSLRGLAPWLWVTTTGSVFAWTWVTLSYREYMTEASHSLFLAMPLPSAVMLYVLLPATALWTALYVIGFKSWILTEDDLAAYRELIAESKRKSELTEGAGAGEPS